MDQTPVEATGINAAQNLAEAIRSKLTLVSLGNIDLTQHLMHMQIMLLSLAKSHLNQEAAFLQR